jgi:hypothetical protein
MTKKTSTRKAANGRAGARPMWKAITIDLEVYAELQKRSTSTFQDSPNKVLRRLFDLDKKAS